MKTFYFPVFEGESLDESIDNYGGISEGYTSLHDAVDSCDEFKADYMMEFGQEYKYDIQFHKITIEEL